MTALPSDPLETDYLVIRTGADITHPHVNVWLPRGRLTSDLAGNVQLLPNIQHTFQGVAQPTTDVETADNGDTAQVYRIISADLRSPGRPRRPTDGS